MVLSNFDLITFKEHVLSEYPKEACGVVINDVFHPCINAHDTPETNFRITGLAVFELERKHGKVQAILHSHPYKLEESMQFAKDYYNPAWASVSDQQAFMDGSVPWGIVATDGEGISEVEWLTEEVKPFERRSFAWFSADCYALVRDWHKLNTGIILPNFTRRFNFWTEGLNTIEDGIRTIPFAEIIPTEKAQIGDVAVMAIRSDVVNHLGVISGNNEMMHQWLGRYTEVARWDRWANQTRYVVRFNK